MRRTAGLLAMVGVALVLSGAMSGCEFTGVNNQPLTFTKGGGDDDMRITVYMENAVNLVPNSEVKVNDVTVGAVRTIEFDGWRAQLTLGVEQGTRLPANVAAKIAQNSQLGAEYLELEVPKCLVAATRKVDTREGVTVRTAE